MGLQLSSLLPLKKKKSAVTTQQNKISKVHKIVGKS